MGSLLSRRGSTKASNTLGEMTSESAEDVQRGLLSMFEKTMEDLRGLVQCRVCVRPMYEPYMLSCGHTFCYSCLAQWFCNHKYNKTCPDCRAKITQQPAPSYLVRDMTQIFVSRAELMADGETTQEHATSQDEEAGIVEHDKLNQDPRTGGLFRGCFKPTVPMPFHGVIHDAEDGVVRCPVCSWELEDGYCNSCQMNYDTDMDGYSEDDDDAADVDVSSDIDLLSFDEEDPSDGEDAERLARENGRIRDLIVNQADDISLDGDGFGLHTPHYNGDFHIPRTGAQGLIGHPARRVDQAASAANLLRYTPSALADVTTTQVHGFSDIDVDVDDEDDDEDEDEEDDEEEDDDEADTSLDGFVVGDELDDEEGQPSEFDTDYTANHADQVRNPSEGEAYWVDDSASDHRTVLTTPQK